MSDIAADGTTTKDAALRRTARRRDETWFYGPAAMALFLVFWEVAVHVSGIPELFLPPPSAIVVSLVRLFVEKGLIYDTGLTLWRIFGGFALGSVIGILLGVMMGTSRKIFATTDIFVAAIYPVPKISLVPLLVIWLGTGDLFLIVLAALGGLFPVLVSTMTGVKQCDPGLILAARDLGASRAQILRHVVIPAAVPAIFAGLRLGLGISIILIVAAEMQTARYGLGAKLHLAGQILETGDVFAILLLLSVIGIVVTKIQGLADRFVSRWRAT